MLHALTTASSDQFQLIISCHPTINQSFTLSGKRAALSSDFMSEETQLE